jgi:signal transduction histidine kinase
LLASYVSITCLVLVALVVPLGRVFAHQARDQLLQGIERDAMVVGSLSEEALEHGTRPAGLDAMLARYNKNPGGRIVVVDASGTDVLDSEASPNAPRQSFTNRPEIVQALAGQRAEGTRHSRTLNADLVFVAVPVASGGIVHGAVRITYPSRELDARVAANWRRLVLLAISALGTVVVVGFVVARGVTRPVRRLRMSALDVAAGKLDVQVPEAEGAPELRDLAHTFNEMTRQVRTLVDAQRAFVADASHQLRTPISVIRVRLDNLADDVPEGSRAAVDSVQHEVARLDRLVDGLLTIARTQGRVVSAQPVDVAAITRERGELWAPLGAEQHVAITVSAPATAVARAEPGATEQILDNLLANALEVAPPRSAIELRVDERAGGVELHVIDHGRGLTAEQRGSAFDRFWRSADAPPGGSGLGLAIVRDLATRVGGTAELRAAPAGGVDAVVTLPAAPG